MTHRGVCARLGSMGVDECSHDATEGKDRSDAVVSVRFTGDEVALLRRMADAQQTPLSTAIRRAALAASTCHPIADLRTQMNQGAAGSSWAFYNSFTSQFVARSTVFSESGVVNYQLPPPNTVTPA
jgi:hypothetical protein